MKAWLAILLPLVLAVAGLAETAPPPLQFHQKIGTKVSLELPFRDHTGRAVRLGDYFTARDRPVLLVPGYVRCEMLCAAVSDGLLRAIQPLKASAGHDFQVLYVSIDPEETDTAALQKKRTWVRRYGRLGCEDGVAYLRGSPDSVAQLMSEIGFEYRYDATHGEYEHPAGFVVVSGEATVTHYQLGVSFPAGEVEQAMAESRSGTAGSVLERFLLICSRYHPLRSPYGDTVMNLLRLMACGVIVGLVLAVKARRVQR